MKIIKLTKKDLIILKKQKEAFKKNLVESQVITILYFSIPTMISQSPDGTSMSLTGELHRRMERFLMESDKGKKKRNAIYR